ncbi:MAG: hypothetical protein EA397_14995 [Deltaproteobacteria bacterium]|nr:MAG: hypothetical protein EA397_14995 [Deltaproteobacteria bacterium]
MRPITLFCLLSLACGEDDPIQTHESVTSSSSEHDSTSTATGSDTSSDSQHQSGSRTESDDSAIETGSDDSAIETGSDDTVIETGSDDTVIETGSEGSELPTGETCEEAIDVTEGGTFSDTTVGAGEDHAPPSGCVGGWASTGPDRAYVLRPSGPLNLEVTVRVDPIDETFDPMIYAFEEDCDAASCLGGTILNGPGVHEELTFIAEAGEETYFIVDGEMFTSGAYDLTVSVTEIR